MYLFIYIRAYPAPVTGRRGVWVGVRVDVRVTYHRNRCWLLLFHCVTHCWICYGIVHCAPRHPSHSHSLCLCLCLLDSSAALVLDDKYVKAYSRRGLVRFKRGKYMEVSALYSSFFSSIVVVIVVVVYAVCPP